MLKIRLSQTGSTNKKKYRIVAIEEGKRRDGEALEILGHYNPVIQPAELTINKERISYWVSKGAQVTAAVKTLMEKK